MAFRACGIVLGLVVAGCARPDPPKTPRERALAEIQELTASLAKDGGLSTVSPEVWARLQSLIDELEKDPGTPTPAEHELVRLSKSLEAQSKARSEPEPSPAASAASDESYSGYERDGHQLWYVRGELRTFTVKAKGGRVLAERIDEAQLGRDYPELYRLVRNARGVDDIGGDGGD